MGVGGKKFLFQMPFRDACNNTLFLRCDQVQHQTQQNVLSLAAQFHRSGCSLMALQYAEKHTKVHRYKKTKKAEIRLGMYLYTILLNLLVWWLLAR